MTDADPRPPPDRTESLILVRAEQDLEEGIRYKVERIRASGHPFFARAMEAGVTGAVSLIQLRERYRDDVRFLCELARRANAGEDPGRLADEHIARALRLKELSLVVREKDPEFQHVLVTAREILAKRLPDLGRMVAVKDPADYDDLVRKAFPDRKHVEAFVEENRLLMLRLLDDMTRHPHILRIPRSWVPKMAEIGRDIIEWQTARVLKGVDEIYSVQGNRE